MIIIIVTRTGKCIDVACEAMGIENRNNDPQAEKTHFIGKKNKAMFPFDIPLYLLVLLIQ